jgi:hypothetical protein
MTNTAAALKRRALAATQDAFQGKLYEVLIDSFSSYSKGCFPMKFLHVNIAVLVSLLGAASARSHEDVVPYMVGSQIVTGGHDDVSGANNLTQRVFGYDFGEEIGDPYVIGDPGFNNGSFAVGVFPNDGLLPADGTNYTLGFDVVTNLLYWDGAGGVSFVAAPDDVSLGLNKGSFTVLVDALGPSGTVPSIGVVPEIADTGFGRIHQHLESQLHFIDGTNPADPNAPDGIYLVGLQLKLPGSRLADSDPIYVVYNNGLDEAVHDAAIEWVEAHLVPEPATWVLALAGAFALAAAGRRKLWRT